MFIIYQEIEPKTSIEEVLKYFKKVLPETRAFKGNNSYHVCLENGNDNIIRTISRWESLEDYAKYREFRISKGSQLSKIADVNLVTYNKIQKEI